MIQFRNAFGFKIISIGLVFFFLFQADLLLSQGENLSARFNEAKNDYKKGNFQRAAFQLLKLAAAYENTQNKSEEIKSRYGQTLLLLGACREKMNQPGKAEENYMSAKKLLGKNYFIQGVNFNHLNVYAKVFDIKMVKSKSDGRVIERASLEKKKKKSPWLLAVGGGAAVVIAALLFLKKSKKSNEPKTANIDIYFSSDPVYPDSNGNWHYQIILKETNGVGVFLTKLDYSPGDWQGGAPIDLFGTDFLTANGTLSADVWSWGYSSDTQITFTIWGDDENGHENLEWSGTVTLKKSSPGQSTNSTTSSSRQEKKGGTGASK